MQNEILTQLHKKLLTQGKTIAVAESCSGGLISGQLTKNPGASNYFLLGVVSYSNKSKQRILHISAKTIAKYGAVSRQVAILMARNIRKISGADLGIGITGLAGPGGATPKKPVGTVYICIVLKNRNICRAFSFRGNRGQIRRQTVKAALRLLCAPLSL